MLRDLRALAERTSTEGGAQRVAWTPVWREARAWLTERLRDELDLEPRVDAAGNLWATLPGVRPEGLIVGSHLDSVPNGGWLDGALGVASALEVLRRWSKGRRPPLTLHLVDWADEEGARFGRSLFGSAAAAGAIDAVRELAHLVDRDGVRLPDALRENGVELEGLGAAATAFRALRPRGYLELHIEQGPVLEAKGLPAAAVLGTMGVERHTVSFAGQAAHSGAAPMHLRQDAFLAGADFALACAEAARRLSGSTPQTRLVATCGVVKVAPGFVTAVPGRCELSLDLRALDAGALARLLGEARRASSAAARRHRVAVEWRPLLRIEPRLFDEALVTLAAKHVRAVTGVAPRLPSGPLHDASEMAALVPTAMIFAQSSPGRSHCPDEDTPRACLEQSIRAFLGLVDDALERLAPGP